MLKRMFSTFLSGLENVLAVSLMVAVILNFSNVVTRYGFGFTISFADEIELYILVFVTFLGAAVVSWRRAHLRMDVLVTSLPPSMQRVIQLFEMVVVLGLMIFFSYQSWSYAAKMFALDRRSDIADLPMWIPHSGLCLGFALIAIVALMHLVQALFSGPVGLKPGEEAGQ